MQLAKAKSVMVIIKRYITKNLKNPRTHCAPTGSKIGTFCFHEVKNLVISMR